MKDKVRVGVKLEGSNRYDAIVEDEIGISVTDNGTNKIYHSYFDKETAAEIVIRLEEKGYDCKIMK